MLARDLWPGQRAVGRRFMIGQGSPDQEVTVVGVIRHLRLRSLVEDLTPQIFIPYAAWLRTPMAFVLATDADPAELIPAVHATVGAFVCGSSLACFVPALRASAISLLDVDRGR